MSSALGRDVEGRLDVVHLLELLTADQGQRRGDPEAGDDHAKGLRR
jgi:hypothetical protein